MTATCWIQFNIKINTRSIQLLFFSYGSASDKETALSRDHKRWNADDNSEDEDDYVVTPFGMSPDNLTISDMKPIVSTIPPKPNAASYDQLLEGLEHEPA